MGARAELRIECRPLGENSTEVVQQLQYDLPGGPLGLLASRFGVRGILEMQAQRSLQTLARRLGPGADAQSLVFVEAGAGDGPGND
jgi:uncharacterized membrane protein